MTVVPADATGSYPALVGYVPVDRSRRVLVYLVDAAIAVAVSLIANVLPLLLIMGGGAGIAGTTSSMSILMVVVVLAYLGASIWALVARSSRLAGVFLGVTYLDVTTGRPAPAMLVLKYLLQGLISAFTFGLAPVIVSWLTCTGPMQRTWFDRTTRLVAADTRQGRSLGRPDLAAASTHPRSLDGVGPVDPVAMPSVAPVGYPPLTSPPAAFSPVAPPPGPGDAPVGFLPPVDPWREPSPAPAPWPGAPEGMPPTVTPPSWARAATPVATSVDGVGLGPIDATPLSGQRSAGTPGAGVVVESSRPEVVIQDAQPVQPAAGPDHTELVDDPGLAPDRQRVPRVTLVGVGDLSLGTPRVLGRNPVAPATHPQSQVMAVVDPSMSISKTHLLVGADEGAVWVIDLHSTNGVAVAGPDGVPERVPAGVQTPVPRGGRVYFGGLRIEVSPA